MNRDNAGRFVKGHKLAGPGRPPLAREAALLEGVKAAVSAENVARLLERLFELALKGNTAAAGLWLAYALGKPSETVLEARLSELERVIGQIGGSNGK